MTVVAEHLYKQLTLQRGRGLDNNLLYYKSRYNRQRGSGLGSIFGSIGRHVLPWLKNVIWPAAKKYALPHAKKAALNLVGDVVLEGKNLKQSIKDQSKGAIKGATQDIIDQYQTGGRHRNFKRVKKQVQKRGKKRKRVVIKRKGPVRKKPRTQLFTPLQLKKLR